MVNSDPGVIIGQNLLIFDQYSPATCNAVLNDDIEVIKYILSIGGNQLNDYVLFALKFQGLILLFIY